MTLGKHLRQAAEDHSTRRRSRQRRAWLHKVDVADFLDAMEVFNVSKATATEYTFSCPFPGHTSGDTTPSAYMNDGSKDEDKATAWKCFGCNRAGNAITFYAEMENVSTSVAAQHLREQYAPDFRAPKGGIAAEFDEMLRKRRAQETERARLAAPLPEISQEHYDDLFGVDWVETWCEWQQTHSETIGYLFERGFEPETLMDWRIGWDERSERITIPVHDARGRLIGVKGRTTKPKKQERVKYRIIGDKPGTRKRYGFAPYEKSRIVFGLHSAKQSDELVLVEGELDVIALWQIGIPAVSTGSAALSETQARLIRDRCNKLIVFFDSDTAGHNATHGYWAAAQQEWKPGVIEIMRPYMPVYVVEDHDDDASAMIQSGRERALRKLIDRAVNSLSFDVL